MELDVNLWLARKEEIARMCDRGATCAAMAQKYNVTTSVMGQVLDAFDLKTFVARLRAAQKEQS